MDQIHKDIQSFQSRCNDYIDDNSMATARSLKNEVQRLEDDAQVGKKAQSIDERLKSVTELLGEAGREGAMSQNHVNALISEVRRLQQKVSRME